MANTLKTANYINSLHLNKLSFPELSAFYARTEKPLKAGLVHGPIIRDCYIMQYVHTGKGVLKINDKSFPVNAGQCFMTFPKALVTLMADEITPWGKSWVCMYGSKVPELLEAINITIDNPVFPWDECPEVHEEILSYMDILKKDNPFFEFDQAICGNKMFKLLFEKCSNTVSVPERNDVKEEYVKRAIQFIEYNFNRKITVGDIATYVGLNRTYFSSLFREYTGQAPQDFLHRQKIEKACEFFRVPGSTVTSVAYSIGYEPRSFIRLFKQIKGIGPGEYKESIAGKAAKKATAED